MAVTFTGTNTGNTYVSGQQYVSAGRVYTANPDGTFSRPNADGSVRSTVGSSQDPRVTFGTTGGGGSGTPRPRAASTAGTGPGNAGVVSGRPVGLGPGVPAAATVAPRTGSGPVTTQVWIGGGLAPVHPGWSDGGDFEQRWGEWGGGLAGLGVMGADLVGSQLTPRFYSDVGGLPSAAAAGAVDFAGYLDAQRAAVISRPSPGSFAETGGLGSTSGTRNDLDGPFYRTGGSF